MSEKMQYLSDKELDALIAEVEAGGMIAPPIYLKSQIMGNISSEVSIEIPESSMKKRRINRQLTLYSLKIAAAAAVAVFSLTAMPMSFLAGAKAPEQDRLEEKIEKDMKLYEEENKKMSEEKETAKWRQMLDNQLGDKSQGIYQLVDGVSDLFRMEDEYYD